MIHSRTPASQAVRETRQHACVLACFKHAGFVGPAQALVSSCTRMCGSITAEPKPCSSITRDSSYQRGQQFAELPSAAPAVDLTEEWGIGCTAALDLIPFFVESSHVSPLSHNICCTAQDSTVVLVVVSWCRGPGSWAVGPSRVRG